MTVFANVLKTNKCQLEDILKTNSGTINRARLNVKRKNLNGVAFMMVKNGTKISVAVIVQMKRPTKLVPNHHISVPNKDVNVSIHAMKRLHLKGVKI
jgi:hypothetical protein